MLPAQCKIPSAVRRPSDKFMYRQPGAVSKSSKQVPKQAEVSGTHLIQSRRTQPALDMRYPSAGPHAPPPRVREPGSPEGDSVQGAGAAREAGAPSRGTHPEPIAGEKRRGAKSFALLSPRPSIRGGGRRLHSPRAHHRSRRARRAAGARPPDAPPLPGPRQQPNPAQITPAESPGGSPRGPLLLHRI
ncbi:hypothetical protein NDU88_003039 [Pleurodeles waltl]|uniref:Uncharacterized protein n=1 Tax=Pleurodeles waltl TaxID=8319 RepID=A0AAV7NNL8_PLEWA|nr:hypothetical protein NDU88_003039 [Pleurodeles waltl]